MSARPITSFGKAQRKHSPRHGVNFRNLPITIEVPTADEIWDAAILKGRYPIAYADAFAAALAHKYRCPLLTGDPDFRAVPDLELDWIGRGAT